MELDEACAPPPISTRTPPSPMEAYYLLMDAIDDVTPEEIEEFRQTLSVKLKEAFAAITPDLQAATVAYQKLPEFITAQLRHLPAHDYEPGIHHVVNFVTGQTMLKGILRKNI